MLKSHTKDTAAMKQARKKNMKKKNNEEETKHKRRLGAASDEIPGGLQLVCGRPTFVFCFTLVPHTLSCSVCMEDS